MMSKSKDSLEGLEIYISNAKQAIKKQEMFVGETTHRR